MSGCVDFFQGLFVSDRDCVKHIVDDRKNKALNGVRQLIKKSAYFIATHRCHRLILFLQV
jgi:hypothetical protein